MQTFTRYASLALAAALCCLSAAARAEIPACFAFDDALTCSAPDEPAPAWSIDEGALADFGKPFGFDFGKHLGFEFGSTATVAAPVVNAGISDTVDTDAAHALNPSCSYGGVMAITDMCTWTYDGPGACDFEGVSDDCDCDSDDCDLDVSCDTAGSYDLTLTCTAESVVADSLLLTVVDVDTGWTDFGAAPSGAGTPEIVYVSSSDGNDADSGLTEALAKATIAAGMSLLEDGEADWLLLKRGDTFTAASGLSWVVNGPSDVANGYMRLGAYGTGARPVIDCVEYTYQCLVISPGYASATPFTSFAITDIHFTVSERLADGGSTSAASSGLDLIAVSYSGGGKAFRNILVEGAKFTGFQFGIVSASDTDSLQIRRNIFTEFFQPASGGTGHGSAVLNSGDNTLLEENIFYRIHDPIMAQVAAWSGFQHSAYLGAEGSSTARGNIVIRSPEGLMVRNGAAFDRNVLALSHAPSPNLGVAYGVLPHVGGLDADVTDNLAIDNDDDWYFGNIATTGSRTFARNMQFRDANTDPDDSTAYEDDLSLFGLFDGGAGNNLGVHNTAFTDNWLSGSITKIHTDSPFENNVNYSGNTFTTNHEGEGNVAVLIDDWLTAESITGTDWDDWGAELISWEEHADYDPDKHGTCSILNYYRDAETTLDALSCSNSNSAPVVNAGADAAPTTSVAFNLEGSCSDDVSATCTWSMTAGTGTAAFTDLGAGDGVVTCSAVASDTIDVTYSTTGAKTARLSCDDGVAAAVTDDATHTVADAGSTLILDEMSTAVAAGAWGFNTQVTSAYSGNIIRVKKISAGTENNIPITAGVIDISALTSACQTASIWVDCGVMTAYDLTGGTNHLTQTTTSQMPLIAKVSEGLQVAGVAGLLAPHFDGTDDVLTIAGTLGLSGDDEVGFSIMVSETTAVWSHLIYMGTASAGEAIALATWDLFSGPAFARSVHHVSVYEDFAVTGAFVALSTYQYVQVAREVGDEMQEVSVYVNGAALTHADGTSTVVLDLGTNETSLGCDVGAANRCANARIGSFVVWSNSPAGADKTAYDAQMATED